jgi:hypothetical protein
MHKEATHMGDLPWTRKRHQKKHFVFPEKALCTSAVMLGSSGSGKSETIRRAEYGGHKVYRRQVIHIDAKGNTKKDDEESEDSAARFVATMRAAGAQNIKVFPSTYYNGWLGSPAELKNRLLSVVDSSESAYYGDVLTNALDLALSAQPTPRNSRHFLANLEYDRLLQLYRGDRFHYQRVLKLNKKLLKEVELRYQVFFAAMAGTLDGTLDYADADAVYLRVRGFVLSNEAPRLGRFLISDFMHYIAERRRAGVQTLLVIDEFNALRMREAPSVLFEQVRDFGGCVIISSQGYAGLGPSEYADRILDACSTYVLHACSDPFPVSRRAGKRWKLETTYTEDEEGNPQPHHRLRHDWRVPETAVMQQEEGQAFWIYKGRAQQVQTAQVPLTREQVDEAWGEIRRQEDRQRTLLEQQAKQRQQRKNQAQPTPPIAPTPSPQPTQPPISKPSPLLVASNAPPKQKSQSQAQPRPSPKTPAPAVPPSPIPPVPAVDDDEPDEL